MPYKPFNLEEWLANPKGKKVVWASRVGGTNQPIKDLAYFQNARREGQRFAALNDDGDFLFFGADELAFELSDLPEEECWVWEYCSNNFGVKWPSEGLAKGSARAGATFWRFRINRNDGTLRGEMVRAKEPR
jgi:hypothetical protein